MHRNQLNINNTNDMVSTVVRSKQVMSVASIIFTFCLLRPLPPLLQWIGLQIELMSERCKTWMRQL